jgi:hypothetical protein
MQECPEKCDMVVETLLDSRYWKRLGFGRGKKILEDPDYIGQ